MGEIVVIDLWTHDLSIDTGYVVTSIRADLVEHSLEHG